MQNDGDFVDVILSYWAYAQKWHSCTESSCTKVCDKREHNLTFKGYYAARNGSFLTSVSGQHIGPIFKGQESKKETFLRFSFDSLSYIIVLVSISLITSFTYT